MRLAEAKGEGRPVTMSRNPTDSEMLREALAQGQGEAGDEHLNLELLSAYLGQTLEPASEEEVSDHLVACSYCRQELLELQAFESDEAPGGGAGSAIRMGSAWGAIRKEIRQSETRHRKAPWPRWFLAVAAGLPFLVLSAGLLHLGTANIALRDMNEDMRRAALGGFSSDESRFVITFVKSGRRDGTPKVVPEGASEVMIRIPNLDARRYSIFTIELSRVDGQSSRRRQLEIAESGYLEVTYPRSALREGEYEIRCFGVVGESEEEEEISLSHPRFLVGSRSLDSALPEATLE